jgi:hypothetical protein
MFIATYHRRTPSFEVRIYRDDELVVWESCASEEDAETIAARRSDLDHVYILVDDGAPSKGPGDVFTRPEPGQNLDEDLPLARMALPEYGTE